MSATNRGATRQGDDHYETSGWAVDVILPHLPVSGHILEPGCGRGSIVGRLIAAGVRRDAITGVEIDEGRAEQCRARHRIDVVCGDFRTFNLGGFGLALGNPPFSLMAEFAARCIELTAPVRGTTALLCRLNWIAPESRGPLLDTHACDVYALDRRPEFVASLHCTANDTKRGCGWAITIPLDEPRPKRCPQCKGTVDCNTSDASEYAWCVWGPGRGGRWYRLRCPRSGA